MIRGYNIIAKMSIIIIKKYPLDKSGKVWYDIIMISNKYYQGGFCK
jgi:hypothetical protein